MLTNLSSSVILALSGWVRRGRALRTPSGPRGSSGKKVSLGAAGSPARIFLREITTLFQYYVAKLPYESLAEILHRDIDRTCTWAGLRLGDQSG